MRLEGLAVGFNAALLELFLNICVYTAVGCSQQGRHPVLVREHIIDWNGEPPSLSRGWVEKALAGLDDADQPAARLTLLTALASYQVDESTIDTFRAQQPGDDKLIAATAWASFTAARRVGTWLSPQTPM